MATRAAIYCRISKDDGDGLGVARQERDCRELAERRGWPVGPVFTDNDVSAYSGRVRPAYGQMIDAVRNREVDAVIVYHIDRLHRRPIELEEFIQICDAAGMKELASVTSNFDLSTGDGQFEARIMAAVARKESDDKSRRTRRKHLELAEAGSPVGGGRPFGYEDDRVTVRDDEAELIREAATRVLAGDTLRSICSDWSRRGIKAVKGGGWTPTSLRRVLTSPRWAGHRTLGFGGPVVARDAWPAVLDEATHHRLRIVLLDPARSANLGFRARSYLLTGFLYCGKCGARMVARAVQPKSDNAAAHRRSYVCASGPNHHGCGGIRIVAAPLEELVAEMVFVALDSPAFEAAMADSSDVDDGAELLAEIEAAEAKLQELAQDWANDALSRAEWLTARSAVERRLDVAKKRLGEQTRTTVLDGLAGDALRRRWSDDDFGLDRKRAVVGAVIERIVVGPAHRGINKFDPQRITPDGGGDVVWRF